MGFEQMRDIDRVEELVKEELAKERAYLTQELERAISNVKTLENKLARCNDRITFLTDKNSIVGIEYDAVRCLAGKIPPQSLLSIIDNSKKQKELLEKSLKVLEQAQEIQKGEIAKCSKKIRIYKEVYINSEIHPTDS